MAAITAPAPAVTSEASRPASIWKNRSFISILFGQIVSYLGDGFHSVALGLWVLQTTGSATAMATIMSVRVAATILLGPFAGTVADRVDRRKLIIAMDLARFALVGAIAWLVATPGTSLLPIVILTGLAAVCANFANPAFTSSLVNIVGKENVAQATSMLQLGWTLSSVLGPVLGGSVVMLIGGGAALTVDAVSFLAAALSVVLAGRFPSPRRADGNGRSFLSDMKEGFGYIKSQPLIRTVVSLAPPVNFFMSAFMLLLPVIAVRVWSVSSIQFGTLEALFPLGYAAGAGLVMALSKKLRRRGWILIGALTLTALFMTAASLMPSASAALVFLFLMGFGGSLPDILFQATVQAEVPEELQGRVIGIIMSLCSVAMPLATLTAGVLADRFSPTLLAAGAGVLLLVVALGLVGTSRTLRQYN